METLAVKDLKKVYDEKMNSLRLPSRVLIGPGVVFGPTPLSLPPQLTLGTQKHTETSWRDFFFLYFIFF